MKDVPIVTRLLVVAALLALVAATLRTHTAPSPRLATAAGATP
jgi:hypothetical protein